MIRPDDRVLEALARLEGSADWEVVREWLRESREEMRDRCTQETDPATLHQSQGAAQVLTEQLKQAAEARPILASKRR